MLRACQKVPVLEAPAWIALGVGSSLELAALWGNPMRSALQTRILQPNEQSSPSPVH